MKMAKMARKFICVLLAALLSAIILTLAGCGQNNEDGKADIFEGHRSEETEEENTWTFYGCWKEENHDIWIIFYENDDCTYEMYWGEDESGMAGSYEVSGEVIRLDAGPRFTPDEDGNLVDSSGEKLYPAEPPSFIYGITFEDEDDASETAETGDAVAFYGCWEYQHTARWLYVYDDGTYEWYDSNGFEYGGSYYLSDGILYLRQDDLSFEAKFGGIVDNNDNLMYSSVLPDYDGTRGQGADLFYGTWESTTGDVWLEISTNGEYNYFWDDGFQAIGYFSMDGEVLVLQNGTRYQYDSQTGRITGDDETMFRSEIPDHIRNYDWEEE